MWKQISLFTHLHTHFDSFLLFDLVLQYLIFVGIWFQTDWISSKRTFEDVYMQDTLKMSQPVSQQSNWSVYCWEK